MSMLIYPLPEDVAVTEAKLDRLVVLPLATTPSGKGGIGGGLGM